MDDKTHYDNQVSSKRRVLEHGEVFTSSRIVNDMLDLVKHETERIDSRFLEPACGTGNFLAEILRRKLDIVEARYRKSQLEYERYSIIALASIYGVEIQEDNVKICRERLYRIFSGYYQKNYFENNDRYFSSAKYILERNILWGNALDLRTPDEKAEPIVFSEWSAVNGSMIKRRDFKMIKLLGIEDLNGPNLFSDLGDDAFIPEPIKKEFPLIHYLDIGENGTS